MKNKYLGPWMIILIIILAVIAGTLAGNTTAIFGVTFYSIFDVVGTLFLRALMLVVVPLVTSSIILGVSKIGAEASFGRLGVKIFGFYIITTLIALLIGLLFVNLFNPGAFFPKEIVKTLQMNASHAVQAAADHQAVHPLLRILYEVIPINVIDALAKGKMLGIIFFSILFGYAISKLKEETRVVLCNFWQGVFDAMLTITHLVMKCLPIGVFCLIAKVFATTGLSSLHSLLVFFLTVVTGLLAFMFIALPLILKWVGGVNPILHFRAMAPALITAFSTSSSAASLPETMRCVEKRAGVSNKICGLVIPLGISINLAGSALYECVAVIFVAHVYGLELSLATQITIMFLSLVASMGISGIPSASLVGIIIILGTLGLPAEGIGLFIAVERILDMFRTTVNIFSDSCCAVLVARSEGEKNVLQGDCVKEKLS